MATPVPFVIELFAGTAGLSKALSDVGIKAVAIDKCKAGAKVLHPVLRLDLTQESAQRQVLQQLAHPDCVGFWAAPPCGTASKARNRPVPAHLRQRGVPNPPPLRSKSQPRGFAHLEGTNRSRVEQANQLYDFTCKCALAAIKRKKVFAIENPATSFLWDIDGFVELGKAEGVGAVTFHNCMFGGTRKKHTQVLHNSNLFSSMARQCDGTHQHEPFGVQRSVGRWVFDTSAEAQYPAGLCRAVAAIFQQVAEQEREHKPVEPKMSPALLQARLAAAKQPRKAEICLVPELKQVITLASAPLEQAMAAAAKPPPDQPWRLGIHNLLARTRVVQVTPLLSGERGVRGEQLAKVKIGLPWSAAEFEEQARAIREHPFDSYALAGEDFIRAVFTILTRGPGWVARERTKRLETMRTRVQQLARAEAALHAQANPEVEAVVRSKRILLFKELLKQAGSKDTRLASELLAGFPLVGRLPESGVWPHIEAGPGLELADLLKSAPALQEQAVLAAQRTSAGSTDDLSECWEGTMREVEAGWATGPHTAEEIAKMEGRLWTPSHRFPLRQGPASKLRLIDDFSASSVNATVTCTEKVSLPGVDEPVGMARAYQSAVRPDRVVSLQLPNKEWLVGHLHADLSIDSARDVLVRTADLRNAYKQAARLPAHSAFSIVAVTPPQGLDDRARFFRLVALPFGASASVAAFLRLAEGIRTIASRLLFLPLGAYFDDFYMFEIADLAESTWATFETLLQLLGWEFATEPAKRQPFAKACKLLGVNLSLVLTPCPAVMVANTDARKLEVAQQVQAYLDAGTITAAQAASLRGRLAFCDGQHAGRCGSAALRLLGERASASGADRKITPPLLLALRWLLWYVRTAAPRVVRACHEEAPVLLFTDGAHEASGTTCGAVLLRPGQPKQCFGIRLPQWATEAWAAGGVKQLVHQAELVAVPLARHVWAEELRGRRLIVFLDSDAARFALIRGASKNWHSQVLVVVSAALEAQAGSASWHARVPGEANPADAPSRLQFKGLQAEGAVLRTVELPGEAWTSMVGREFWPPSDPAAAR